MLTTARKLLDLLSAREKTHLYLIFAALVGLAFVDMAGVASILPFIAVVANPDVIQTNRWLKLAYDSFGFTSLQSFLFSLGMLVLGLLVFSNLFKALIAWLSLKYDNRLNYMLARRLLASYLARPYEFFLSHNTVELGKIVLSEARLVIAGVLGPAMQLMSSFLVALFILALLLAVNPVIALTITIVIGGPYGVIYLVTARRLARLGRVQYEANSMKHKVVSEALSGIKDLKILGRAGVFLERFSVHAWRHGQINATVGAISQLPRFALETIAFGGILLIVLFKLGSDQNASEMVPILALYAFAGYRLLPAIQQIFANISTMRYNLYALTVVHQDLKGPGVAADPDRDLAETQNLQPLPLTRALVLRNVAYGYHGTQEPAIRGINLTIVPNTSIGLVGATGSGKTTTVDLILGLLTPTSGQLLADDIEINSDNIAQWQRNLGYVPQHIFLSDDTITRNIAFAVPDQEIDMVAVVHAARIANLHAFIEKELPDGYETVIGERGVRLSGGQRQRIGIARALYHDPTVLIMDEATSALDNITEEAVIEALRTLSGEKTIIMIAHRLTTVKECGVIYLMEKGHIVSQGTYAELLKSSAWFKAATRTGA
jgi:ABC-type bacteriocin/lantibiotic exporter with double-glycine peptidase domain